jgi:hypothetical protein
VDFSAFVPFLVSSGDWHQIQFLSEVIMKAVTSLLLFACVSAVCSLPVALVASRMQISWFVSGYFATDRILLFKLWLFFTLLLICGGWIHVVPGARPR